MSTGPTGANGHFKVIKRTNLNLTRKDWCGYIYECKEQLDSNSNLCDYCKYKKLLDIPKMLEAKKQ